VTASLGDHRYHLQIPVQVRDLHVRRLREPSTSVEEEQNESGVTSLIESPTPTNLEELPKVIHQDNRDLLPEELPSCDLLYESR
jgi:hypothetical protein